MSHGASKESQLIFMSPFVNMSTFLLSPPLLGTCSLHVSLESRRINRVTTHLYELPLECVDIYIYIYARI